MSSRKRVRSSSVFSSGSRSSQPSHHLPNDTINPLSHSDGTIKQLRTAGLTADDLLPSNYIPDFPHRPIRPSHQQQQQKPDDDDDHDADGSASDGSGADDDDPAKERQRQRMRDAQAQQLGFLTNVVLRLLEEGDVPRAKRAFGLLRRSKVRGRPVDLRKDALWSLGAEILMRDGEVRSRSVMPEEEAGPRAAAGEGGEAAAGRDDGAGERATPTARRWGSASNMPQLRAYLESLVRQYPYNRLHPRSISDLDFHPVLFSCEVYNTWVGHRHALERLEGESEAWSDDDLDLDIMPEMIDMPDYNDGNGDGDGGRGREEEENYLTGRERRLRGAKAALGLQAMSAMRDVAARMDALMENTPYSRSAELLRLRGMVALYIGDLSVPPPPRTADEEEEGDRVRQREQERARVFFVRMVKSGGRADACTERWLRDESVSDDDYGTDDDDDDDLQGSQWGGLPVFSSMPML
ncbi:hypothetical protein Daus18300_003528 [Diaporthe australafricana]|uniref:Uncharacterized protein n=1 Tax=Diaporthe australafricana TaxID=127596 RepID=A0ABR3XEY9_9PEZI